MRTAETVLNIIQDRGKRGLSLYDVYRQLYNPDLYLRAYAKIQQNQGALTQGTTEETADGMSQQTIDSIIEALRHERWQWRLARRIYIEKKNSTKKRPLGLPTWTDKLLQEVIRSILEAYYEPQQSDASHGFRLNRGCHTALKQIQRSWTGTKWLIEGDIKGCFDNIDHAILMKILREKIHDNRFLRLIEGLLKAGYCEEWTYHPTLSGTPQGGVISPILANLYLDRLDQYVTGTLIPEFTRGKTRKAHPEYNRLRGETHRRRVDGNWERVQELRRQRRNLPSVDPMDPNYRRLRYIRYADDFLLSLVGSKAEAEKIKERLAEYLQTRLNLTLASEKTLITHAETGRARFLGYEIGTMASQTKLDTTGRRMVNGKIRLHIPNDVIESKRNRYLRDGKVMHRTELLNQEEFDIICLYQSEYRGLVEYYAMAHNLSRLAYVRWTMETSLLKTLAAKGRTTVRKTSKRLRATQQTPQGPRQCLKLIVPRAGKKPLEAIFGGLSLARRPNAAIKDQVLLPYAHKRSAIIDRLLRTTCELCGNTADIEIHHVRKLADLKKPGQREKPLWRQVMIALRRKTLAVCRQCHNDIHHNRQRSVKGYRRAG